MENKIDMLLDYVAQITQELTDIKNTQQQHSQQLSAIQHSIARIENEHGEKINALFDGYSMRGDQIARLQEHLDERLDAIQTDLSYIVSKIAQHERKFVRLNAKG
ncbi:hypothetical protein [Carboxydocella sp. ULO1]|uniref:hypothetical protein n=1 Tax=Carboxydocella sp. ULO1 TaxID=1926599 RepID=UPI0009ACF930|nr:hypothetical protein [Carboxydocella sp. ULO1]GAW28955.1 hypothetical protein ULO1_15250 [Carboxydocella sp. ULO1]